MSYSVNVSKETDGGFDNSIGTTIHLTGSELTDAQSAGKVGTKVIFTELWINQTVGTISRYKTDISWGNQSQGTQTFTINIVGTPTSQSENPGLGPRWRIIKSRENGSINNGTWVNLQSGSNQFVVQGVGFDRMVGFQIQGGVFIDRFTHQYGNNTDTFEITQNANICFPPGTVLSLDQGDVEIQNVDTKKHTLNGKPILFVTKTAPTNPDVVCFEKDAFAPNVPSQRFECSRAHGIEFEGLRKMAQDWVDADQIHFVPNTHTFLYSLLLETHEMMDVYNIRAETLNPVRKVAQMYFAKLRKEKESC